MDRHILKCIFQGLSLLLLLCNGLKLIVIRKFSNTILLSFVMNFIRNELTAKKRAGGILIILYLFKKSKFTSRVCSISHSPTSIKVICIYINTEPSKKNSNFFV